MPCLIFLSATLSLYVCPIPHKYIGTKRTAERQQNLFEELVVKGLGQKTLEQSTGIGRP